jgi:D-threo-aldose 1-dehydrogenase
MYGDGRAETRVGKVLAGLPRDSYVLSSKVGRLVRPGHPESAGTGHDWIYDYSRDGILRSIDESLTRIGVDHLDIAYIHDCDGHWDDAITYAWPTLDDLRSQGVLRSIGVGMTQAPMPARFVRETSIDVLLLAGRYSLIDPEGLDELLPLCVEKDVSVVPAQTLHGGLIEGGPDQTYHYRPVDPETRARVDGIRRICTSHGVPTAAAGLQFVLAHPAVKAVLNGPSSPAQFEQSLTWYRHPIPLELWSDLRDAGLIRADAPTPTTAPTTTEGA